MSVSIILALSMPAQEADADAARRLTAERLDDMKEALAAFDVTCEGQPVALGADPVFRLGQQGNGMILDGAIFLWTDEIGRPEIAVQTFLHRYLGRDEGDWTHEFTSLSTGRVEATLGRQVCWSPAGPGATFRTVPDAPRPAPGAALRLRQMRSLAGQFQVEHDVADNGRFVRIRMLTTPIARYGRPGSGVEDGAMFAFVEGTDSEVFLFLEARPGADGPEWQYACAPMTCLRLRVAHAGRVVWELPRREVNEPREPFYAYQCGPRLNPARREESR